MSQQTETPRLESELLASAVESYLVHRYPDLTLGRIDCSPVQQHDALLARALLHWRRAAGWPKPYVIGEARCVDCHRILGYAPSACEDEDVCAKCAEPAHVG